MSQVVFSFPEPLIERMRSAIPSGERSQVVAKIVEKEIEAREQSLYHLAQELENNLTLQKEMLVWDEQFGSDGLENV